jgi:hypothetical protein
MTAETRAHDTARSRRWANVDIRSDEEKENNVNLVEYVERRASFLRREYDLDDTVARALGWRELGFSSSGVADMMEVTEGTAEKYLDALRREVGDDYVDAPTPPVGEREIERPIPGFVFRGERR